MGTAARLWDINMLDGQNLLNRCEDATKNIIVEKKKNPEYSFLTQTVSQEEAITGPRHSLSVVWLVAQLVSQLVGRF